MSNTTEARITSRTHTSEYTPSARLPSAHGLLYSKQFERMSMDDLQVCLATGELTKEERARCMKEFCARLYK